MKVKSKPKLGQWIGPRLYFTDDEKKLIINDYLTGNDSKDSVFRKYTGYEMSHGKITKWMQRFDIEDRSFKSHTFDTMAKQKKKGDDRSKEFEVLKLENRIKELEKQLQTAEMKAIAFSTMVDIAEKEFNVPIRKKHGTKP